MSRLNVVDTSAWLEYLADSPRASLFADVIEDPEHLLVPGIVLYEVIKWTQRERGAAAAEAAREFLKRGHIVGMDEELIVSAASLKLPLADSLIYATAQSHRATLWTQDAHFEHLADVRYFAKPSRGTAIN